MQAFAFSLFMNFSFWLFQTQFNALEILERFGFPTFMSVVVFFYFRGLLKAKEKSLDAYRAEALLEMKNQTEYLKKLYVEARAVPACKFEKIK